MCYIRTILFFLAIYSFQGMFAQENLTGYFQPKTALNYKITDNYKHNFSLAKRSFIFEDEASTFRVRQLDLVHFSNLKIRDNQSVALGIQYRFRENFESDKSNELRLTQQFNITTKPRVIRYGHRFRSEQRITDVLTIHRFRYRFTLDFPLKGEELDVGEPYFVGNLEPLLSVAAGHDPEYDGRVTANIGWLLQEKTKLQFGLEYRTEDYTQEQENILFFNTNLVLSL